MDKTSQELLAFIDKSSTSFHAVDVIQKELETLNYQQLIEADKWTVSPNSKYYITRADGSLLMIHTPKNITKSNPFKIIGAHTDSPCLKVKSNPTSEKSGYCMLNVEVYGGVLLSSWFDKDIQLGGRIFTENEAGELKSHLVTLPYKLRIPRLAIHLDREVNTAGFKINAQEHVFPVMGLDTSVSFEALLLKEVANSKGLKVLSTDLFMFDAQASSFGGVDNEFIYAPRLDNLSSTHAALEALKVQDCHENDFQVAVFFQHEEIGSKSQNGGDSNFLEVSLNRITSALEWKSEDVSQAMAKSYFISADMAHAVHPNYAEKHDKNHQPHINKGPVIKANANIRYATDAFSIAKFKQWCHKAEVEYQDFCSRNDVGCGSTIGPMTAAKLGVATIDIGNPMLSMHSIREMAGSKDHGELIKVFDVFYKS